MAKITKQLFQPHESENLLFVDTEFTSLDPKVGELLSVGIVTQDGRELYLELDHEGEESDWAAKHIVPTLKSEKVSAEVAKSQIREFIGDTNPYAVAFVDNYDLIYLTNLFGEGNLPFRWMSIDMTSILFALGHNPVKFAPDQPGAKSVYKKLGIDLREYRIHHALDDARLLRTLWLALTDTK